MLTVYKLTMVGRNVCYKAPPQVQVWPQSHTSSLVLPRLYDGLYTVSLGTENLQRQTYGEIFVQCPCTWIYQPQEGDMTSFKNKHVLSIRQ